jgi:hypothetical protein
MAGKSVTLRRITMCVTSIFGGHVRRASRSAVALLALTTALLAGTAVTPAYAAESPVLDLGLAPGQRINKTVIITPTLAEGADVKRIVLYVHGEPIAVDNTAPWGAVALSDRELWCRLARRSGTVDR